MVEPGAGRAGGAGTRRTARRRGCAGGCAARPRRRRSGSFHWTTTEFLAGLATITARFDWSQLDAAARDRLRRSVEALAEDSEDVLKACRELHLFGLTHQDYRPVNLRVLDGVLVEVWDWDLARLDWQLYDVAFGGVAVRWAGVPVPRCLPRTRRPLRRHLPSRSRDFRAAPTTPGAACLVPALRGAQAAGDGLARPGPARAPRPHGALAAAAGLGLLVPVTTGPDHPPPPVLFAAARAGSAICAIAVAVQVGRR